MQHYPCWWSNASQWLRVSHGYRIYLINKELSIPGSVVMSIFAGKPMAVASHEYHGVWSQWQSNFCSKAYWFHNREKINALHNGSLWGQNIAKRVVMSWRYHDFIWHSKCYHAPILHTCWYVKETDSQSCGAIAFHLVNHIRLSLVDELCSRILSYRNY